jgi:hypothetical protein
MKDWQSQVHVKWEGKYHVVIIPKYRREVLYGRIRRRVLMKYFGWGGGAPTILHHNAFRYRINP